MLESFGRVVLPDTESEVDLIVQREPVVAILTRGRGRVTRSLIDRCSNLRVVARAGVGVDNIDLAAANERALPVIYAPNSTTSTVAEHTLMLMLASARRLLALGSAVQDGNWEIRDGYEGVELAGKTVGILGMGAIGRRVAMLAEAFGMRVLYWSPSSRNPRYQYFPMERVLAEADIVTIHVELNSATHHLIGGRELALMRPGAILINTARGAIIDQHALTEALLQKRLGAFATDVLEEEPPRHNDPLLTSDRVLITPHVAALTDATYRTMCLRTAANVLAVLRNEEPEEEAIYNRHHITRFSSNSRKESDDASFHA